MEFPNLILIKEKFVFVKKNVILENITRSQEQFRRPGNSKYIL